MFTDIGFQFAIWNLQLWIKLLPDFLDGPLKHALEHLQSFMM